MSRPILARLLVAIWLIGGLAAAGSAQGPATSPASSSSSSSASPGAAASGDAGAALMIVLDGSGSMWAKLGKDQKIMAAREVLTQALPKAPPLSIGLTAYGHRRTGDCSDVEVAIPVAKGNAERIMAYLEKFNPKGKGPLGNALKAASEAMADKALAGARRSMMVITDNADNCRVDTCELAQELRQGQPGLTIHVVTLGVAKEETVPLACLATATGGRLFKAETAADIANAVEQGLKVAAGGPGPAVAVPGGTVGGAQTAAVQQSATGVKAAAPKPPEPAGPPGLSVTGVLAAGGAEIVSGLRWRISAPGVKPGEQRIVYEGEDASPSLDLPPGTYRIEASFGLASADQSVTVGPAVRTVVQVPLDAGVIQVKDSSGRNGTSGDRIFYTLYAAATGPRDKPRALALSSDAAPIYNVSAGTYIVGVQQGLARIERTVTISPGVVAEVDVPLYLGEMRLSAVAAEGGGILERVVFQVFEDDPEAPGGLRELVRSSAARPEFSLPAGSYHVIARQDGAEAREVVAVKPGSSTIKTLVLASGRLSLSTRLPQRTQGKLEPDLISYRIERMGAPRSARSDSRGDARGDEVSRAHMPEYALALKAGKYRVESRYGAINARTVREVEIKTGATQALVLELDAGLVTLRLADKTAATAAERLRTDVLWEIHDASGRHIWTTGQVTPRLPLAAGRYTARAETRAQTVEHPFHVATGDDKTIEIELK